MSYRTSLPLHETEDDQPKRKVIRKGKSRRIVRRSKGAIESHTIYKEIKPKKKKQDKADKKYKRVKNRRKIAAKF